MKNPTISRTQRTPFGVLFALVAERALPLSRPLTAALRRRREWVAQQKTPRCGVFCKRCPQSKEPQERAGDRRRATMRRDWAMFAQTKRHSAAFLRSRNRQIKEPQEQFIIATHGDYDLVEGNEKSHNFPNAKDTIRCPFCVGCGAGFAPFATSDSRYSAEGNEKSLHFPRQIF